MCYRISYVTYFGFFTDDAGNWLKPFESGFFRFAAIGVKWVCCNALTSISAICYDRSNTNLELDFVQNPQKRCNQNTMLLLCSRHMLRGKTVCCCQKATQINSYFGFKPVCEHPTNFNWNLCYQPNPLKEDFQFSNFVLFPLVLFRFGIC